MSDPAPSSFSLAINAKINSGLNLAELDPKPDKMEWNKDVAERFTVLLQGPACKEVLNDVESKGVSNTQSTIDATASLFSSLLKDTAKLSGMSIKKGIKPKKAKFSKFTKVIYHLYLCVPLTSPIDRDS